MQFANDPPESRMRNRIFARNADKPDPAQGGYFIVEDTPFIQHPHIFARVTGYTAAGELLMQTNHSNDWSRDIEIAAWEGRGAVRKDRR